MIERDKSPARVVSALLAAAIVAVVVLAPARSDADVIKLESGGRVVGKIVRESPTEVVIDARFGGRQTILREEIAEIVREEETDAPPARRAKKAPEEKAPEEEAPEEKAPEEEAESDEAKPAPERSKRRSKKKPTEDSDAPKWSSKDDRTFTDLAKKAFATDDRSEQAKIFAEAAALPDVPRSRLKRLTKAAFQVAYGTGARSEAGTSGKRTLGHPDFPGEYLVYGEGKNRRALLIGLHGGGQGSGDGANSAQKWSFASGMNAVSSFPTVLEKVAVAWNREDNERYVIELIETLKRTYAIDTNRVYLVGHSMGGFGTWSIGSHYADYFAAISPNAGGVYGPGKIPNLRNTPIYFYHSLDDATVGPKQDQQAAKTLAALQEEHGGYEHVYQELTGIGHGLPKDGLKPIVDWLFTHTRDPFPSKVVFEPSRSYKRTMYWLKSETARGRIVAEWTDNVCEIAGPRADYSVFVNPKLCDLDEEVVVKVNGEERFRGSVRNDAGALLESIVERRDPAMYFTGRIDVR